MPCLRRCFVLDSIIYHTKWGKYIYLICFEVTYKKTFLTLSTNRTKLDYFKKLRYTRRPHTAKIHTLFKTLNSEIN